MIKNITKTILKKMNLYTFNDLIESQNEIIDEWEVICKNQASDFKLKIKELKSRNAEVISTYDKEYKEMQKVNAKDKKALQNRIEELNLTISAYIDEIGIKNSEISSLNKQIKELKEELKNSVKLVKLPADTTRGKQTMRIGARNVVRSRIASPNNPLRSAFPFLYPPRLADWKCRLVSSSLPSVAKSEVAFSPQKPLQKVYYI